MSKRSIGACAAAGFAALAAPVLLAAPASASVTGIKVEGSTAGSDCAVAATCRISVTLSGSDATSPITVKVDGVTIVDALTPANSTPTIEWTPPAKAKYTVTVTQAGKTAQLEVGVPGRAESNTGIPSGATDLIKLLTGSAG
ncbi:hypothetical protein LTV02_37310 [Nocardia yamanashiensis]|uniref:hypothetical protein n=1 Tax=Nocardia yamanashiensis TaxID=209247 RepID=UPI000AC70FBC|nr:hypothetical protein [Nocardia yamanashiensis]UGT41528.1 hypothetical protein LTV02_37310 [Nocardia yamanashiensis]